MTARASRQRSERGAALMAALFLLLLLDVAILVTTTEIQES